MLTAADQNRTGLHRVRSTSRGSAGRVCPARCRCRRCRAVVDLNAIGSGVDPVALRIAQDDGLNRVPIYRPPSSSCTCGTGNLYRSTAPSRSMFSSTGPVSTKRCGIDAWFSCGRDHARTRSIAERSRFATGSSPARHALQTSSFRRRGHPEALQVAGDVVEQHGRRFRDGRGSRSPRRRPSRGSNRRRRSAAVLRRRRSSPENRASRSAHPSRGWSKRSSVSRSGYSLSPG